MDLRTALRTGIARLRDARVPSYTLAAEMLLLYELRRDRAWFYAHPEEPIADAVLNAYLALIARRANGEPTQHLTGKQEFWSLEFEVSPNVLIPRPETEHVIEVALDRLALRELRAGRPQKTAGGGFLIADIGTGSGCLGVALAIEVPQARVYATDISQPALAVARKNALRHSVASRMDFVEADLSDGLLPDAAPVGGFDLVVSNPPYIPRRHAVTLAREVREHEPELALYGGEEGYELYPGLFGLAARYLKPGGILVAEMGHDSLSAVRPLLESSDWTSVGVTSDLAGIPRVIAAERTTAK